MIYKNPMDCLPWDFLYLKYFLIFLRISGIRIEFNG